MAVPNRLPNTLVVDGSTGSIRKLAQVPENTISEEERSVTWLKPLPVPRNDIGFRIFKRSFDISIALVALILLMPFLVVTSIIIKLNGPGPVLFRQDRYGLNNELFSMYKFRTMRTEKSDVSGVTQTVKGDPRITSIGRFLRRTSFDELPQLFNILKGDMSIVGPRPHVPGMLAAGVLYEEFDSRYHARHVVRPGLTGLAQVNGFRGATTNEKAARMRLNYDLEYIDRQSAMLDIKITLNTFWKEFFSGSGY